MRTILTEAVILRRYKIGEADRLLLAFTRELGKILIVAKSVRKTTSRLAGHLEPCQLVELEIVKGSGDFYRLTGAISANAPQKYSLESIRHREILAETIDLSLGEEEPNQMTFDTFVSGIQQIENSSQDSYLIAIETIIKLLESLGFRPELDRCAICQQKVESQLVGWSSSSGGLLCEACLTKVEDLKLVESKKTIVLMRVMQSENQVAQRLKAHFKNLDEANKLLSDYLLTHLPRPLKSLNTI